MTEEKEKIDKENQTLKKIIAKKVKTMEKKLDKAKIRVEKYNELFHEFYAFFTIEIKEIKHK